VPLRVNASAGDFYAAKHGGILEANHAVKIRINMNYIVMPLRGSNREQKHDLIVLFFLCIANIYFVVEYKFFWFRNPAWHKIKSLKRAIIAKWEETNKRQFFCNFFYARVFTKYQMFLTWVITGDDSKARFWCGIVGRACV
jgi:hypothetical protein